jgi:hypothetical protein
MADRVERLNIHYQVQIAESGVPLFRSVAYTLVAAGQDLDQFRIEFSSLPEEGGELARRTQRLVQALEARFGQRQLEIEGAVVDVRMKINWLDVPVDNGALRLLFGESGRGTAGWQYVEFSELSAAQRRLLDSVNATIDRLAWEDLRRRFDAPGPPRTQLQVFISHRAGHEKFAEALANRLGQEGILPWFDKWEIQAGDSVPGKIEEGLRDSMAFIPIVTADYQEGRWATDELHNAIAKRVEEEYKIIPVLLEHCERPELIRHLRYVDFSKQDPETFESKFGELIDGIYSLELNPIR